MNWRSRAARALMLLLLVFASSQVQAQTCDDENSLRSAQPGAATELSFRNTSPEPRRIYWLDQDGRRKFYAAVDPGKVLQQPTSASHVWVVTDDAETCLQVVTAAAEPATVEIGQGGEAAMVTPPPAGVQQDIATRPARSAPPGSAVAGKPATDTDAEPQPVASPVEQFELTGAYTLRPRADNTVAFNNTSSRTPEVAKVKADWDSSHWQFEAIPETPFVRIRNQWKGQYLEESRGLRVAQGNVDTEESHWTFEPVDGLPFVQLRNRASGNYLVFANGDPGLTEKPRSERDSHWQIAAVGPASSYRPSSPARAPIAAISPPRDSGRDRAYEEAVLHCRDLGGFWTGSTCRPQRGARFSDCGRGWAWSDISGECEWIGANERERVCPPWMVGRPPNCQADMACRGGELRFTQRGHAVCLCPSGARLWGEFPNFRCVRDAMRPEVLIGAVVGGVLIGGAITAIAPNKWQKPSKGGPPSGGGVPLLKNGGTTTIVTPIGAPQGPNAPCAPWQSGKPGNCIDIPYTCEGGIKAGGGTCQCPQGTRPQSLGGRSIKCVPQLGGGGLNAPHKPVACKEGESTRSGCACVAPMSVTVGTTCATRAISGPTGTQVRPACREGQSTNDACRCTPPMEQQGTRCITPVKAPPPNTRPINTPPDCKVGQNTASGCRCAPPLQVLAAGRCGVPPTIKRDAGDANKAQREAAKAAADAKSKADAEARARAANTQKADGEARRRAAEEALKNRRAEVEARRKAAQDAAAKRAEGANAKPKAGPGKCPDGWVGTPPTCARPNCPPGKSFRQGQCQ